MKIIFLSDDFPPQSFGGAGISTYELAKGVQKAGHEVFVITTCRMESEAGESVYEGLRVFRIASDYPGRLRAWVSLNNRSVVREVDLILRELTPDVVHINNIHTYLSWACFKIAKQHARVVLWTARDVMAFNYGKLVTNSYLERLDARTTWINHIMQAGKRYNPLRNFFIRRYLRYADALFAVSEALALALRQNAIGPVKVVHTGIDVNAWNPDKFETDLFRTKHNLLNKKVVFFGGRMNALREVLDGFVHIAEKMPEVVLVVAGQGPIVDSMKDRASQLRIKHRIIWVGWLAGDDLKIAYAASDVVLVPSAYFDSLPRSVLEGMAMAKPIVATKYGGAVEAVIDGKTGYIIDSREPKQIAQKLTVLLSAPDQAARMGAAGRERIMKEFSLEKMVREYLQNYKTAWTLREDSVT